MIFRKLKKGMMCYGGGEMRMTLQKTLKKIKCPVLSIFGEKDVLVPPAENKGKMATYLKQAGVPYKIVTINNCGHDMITNEGLNGTDANWPTVFWQWKKQPPEFANSIIDWIITR